MPAGMAVADFGGRHRVERIYGKELFLCCKGFYLAHQESCGFGASAMCSGHLNPGTVNCVMHLL
jgi:hypothetical protein